jgi:hypothetical protein
MNGDMFDLLHGLYLWLMPPIVISALLFALWRRLAPIIGMPLPRVRGMARVAAAIAANALVTWLIWEWYGGPIGPYWGLLIDSVTFLIVVMPPRSYFQCTIAAIFFVQVALDSIALLLTKMGVSGFELPIWQAMKIMNCAQLVALLAWLGGTNAYFRKRLDRTASRVVIGQLLANARQGRP